MITKILLLSLTLLTLSHAQSNKDQDMDGVPDDIDQCLNTPFLNEVNDKGCSTSTLIFQGERDSGSLDIGFGYGYSNNEELVDRDTQHTTKFQISYYLDNWSYSLRTGYFSTGDDNGMQDTTLKIKRKFKLTKSLKVGFGIGVRLPTYDFTGNNTDYTLYSSVVYYPKSSLSVFAGVTHTFINDEEIMTPLQDINTFYVGSGYFFTKDLYANLAYSYAQSKFTTNDPAHSIISTVLYKINNKWFTTLSYSHQIEDDLKNSASIKFGYSIW
ncbi:MAG: hypothetical protein HKP62_08480 [Sulfurovum sp.]|nr:hypothetical protein [Sulfurovum sp.]NNJ46036.1 hypothetical protein [Sulfurovum sp.]